MKKLHLICNAHIDPIWQWEWEEGAAATLSTFQSAVNLAEEYDYIFCHNEVTVYKYTEKYAPQLFKEIQKFVKAGKWHIMGGWYLQPDCLMPAGEGIIRQIREGELYFREKFGIMPTVATNFDPFGHSRGIVQILYKCGQNGYLFMRPYGKFIREQLELPAECFLWEGYDGSRIKATRITEYNSVLGCARDKVTKDIERQKDLAIGLSCWGVGNHGGGPSAKDLSDIEKLIKESEIEIVYSTPEKYFEEVKPTKIYSKSLISCMVGCYTSMIRLKKAYRTLERQLYFTEKIASIAALKNVSDYPADLLQEVTEDMLNVQFHDILPGDMIKAGEENGFTYIKHGLHLLNQARADAFFALCKGQLVAEENTYPIMVFNPKAARGKQIIECELSIIPTENFEESFSYIEIYDRTGKKLKSQTVKEAGNIPIDWRKRVVFEADLEPLQISRYTAKTIVLPKKKYLQTDRDIVFENGEKKVVIGIKTGLIESYVVNGTEYVKEGGLFVPFMYDDTPDPWGMNEMYVGHDPKQFSLLEKPDGVFEGMRPVQVIEDGDIYLEAEAFFGIGLTRMRLGYKIYKSGTAVDVNVELFPSEPSKAVKLHLNLGEGRYIGEQIFGTEELYADGRECIAQNFVALEKAEDRYFEIITPDTFGSSYKDGVVSLTLLKTATYCAHPQPGRPLLRDGIFIPKIDMGECDYSFRIDIASENTLKRNADLFAEKPYALNIFPTIDTSDDNGTCIDCSNPNIAVVTIKKARQAEGYIFRLFNCDSSQSKAHLVCGNAKISLTFEKYEVKTVIFHDNSLTENDKMII